MARRRSRKPVTRTRSVKVQVPPCHVVHSIPPRRKGSPRMVFGGSYVSRYRTIGLDLREAFLPAGLLNGFTTGFRAYLPHRSAR